nr:TIGR02444 family protein [uncultured Pseudomonas sp.]
MPPDLWRFAEEVYQRPGVEAACLQLQAQGMDVCLLLCALWLDARNVPWDEARGQALRNLAQPWQTQVVMPLRQLRQSWRAAAQDDSALKPLREQVKRLELEAERELLQRLATLSREWPSVENAPRQRWLTQLTTDPDALQTLRVATTQACV